MYTQNHGNCNTATVVKSFPNKDSILQMKKMNNSCTEETRSDIPQVKRKSDTIPYNILLLFGALLCTSEESEISCEMFLMISGIILSL